MCVLYSLDNFDPCVPRLEDTFFIHSPFLRRVEQAEAILSLCLFLLAGECLGVRLPAMRSALPTRSLTTVIWREPSVQYGCCPGFLATSRNSATRVGKWSTTEPPTHDTWRLKKIGRFRDNIHMRGWVINWRFYPNFIKLTNACDVLDWGLLQTWNIYYLFIIVFTFSRLETPGADINSIHVLSASSGKWIFQCWVADQQRRLMPFFHGAVTRAVHSTRYHRWRCRFPTILPPSYRPTWLAE